MQSILNEIESRSWQILVVDVSDFDAAKLPKSLCQALGMSVEFNESRSFDVIQDKLGSIDVLNLFGFENVTRGDKKRWVQFINQRSDSVKQRIDRGVHATVLVASIQLEPAVLEDLRVDTTLHIA